MSDAAPNQNQPQNPNPGTGGNADPNAGGSGGAGGILDGGAAGGDPNAGNQNQNGADGKPAEAKPAEGEGAGKQDGKVPEVTYDLKVPEGSNFAPETIAQATALAKKIGLSNEHAQALLNENAAAVKAAADAEAKALADQNRQWAQAVAADKELGGPNLAATTVAAQRAFRAAPKEVQDLIRAGGYQNHPGFVRMFAHFGKLLGEDGLPGGSSAIKPQDARAIYTSMPNP